MVLGNPSISRRGTAGIYVEGVEKTLKALRKLEPELFEKSIQSIRAPMEQAATMARTRYPADRYPMTGWGPRKARNPIPPKTFPQYNQNLAQKGISVVVNKRTGKSSRSYKLAALVQKNAGGVIYDMARRSPNNFGSNLMRFGAPSRIMWPTMRSMQGALVGAVVKAARKAELAVFNAMPNKRFDK